MPAKTKKKKPEVVFRNGKPAAVILEMAEYRKMLERLEDSEDLKELDALRKRPLSFRSLDEFLQAEKIDA